MSLKDSLGQRPVLAKADRRSGSLGPPPRPRSRALLAVLAVAVLLAGGLGIRALRNRGAAPPPAPSAAPVLTVSTAAVASRPLNRKLDLTGSVTAWELLPVLSSASGLRITAIEVEEGEHVTRGQLLAQLDDATLRAQRQQAQARLSQAQAQLTKVRQPNRRQDLAALKAAVAQAEAARNSARDMYNRVKDLQAEGAVTASELIARESNYRAAEAGVDQAKQRLSMAMEGGRIEDVRLAEAAVAEARGALALNGALLAQTRVTAPDNGYVLTKAARLGDVTAPGQRLFTIVRDGRLQVEALVPESDLRTVQVGQLAQVVSPADPGVKATGRVREIAPGVEQTSRQGVVKINLPPDSGFKVGQFARARLNVGRLQVPALPAAALLQRDTGAEVFVVDNADVAHQRPVTTGARDGGWVQITGGLHEGDRVVISGVGYLKDGDKVRVVPPLTPLPSPLASAKP